MAALTRLHRWHVERVPYETFWLHLGEDWDVDQVASVARIAHGRRGGYCLSVATDGVGDWHFANLSGGTLAGVSIDVHPVDIDVFAARHHFNTTSPDSSFALVVRTYGHGPAAPGDGDVLRGCVLTRTAGRRAGRRLRTAPGRLVGTGAARTPGMGRRSARPRSASDDDVVPHLRAVASEASRSRGQSSIVSGACDRSVIGTRSHRVDAAAGMAS